MCNTWGNCIRNFKKGEIATTILVLSLIAMGVGSILGLRNMNILKGSAQSACQYESTAYLWDESGKVLTQLTESAPFRVKSSFPNGEYTSGGEGERLLYGKLHKLVDLREKDKDIMVQVQLTGIGSTDDILYPACTEFNNFPTQTGNPRKGACREWGNDIVILQLKCGSRNEYGWVLKNSAISRIVSSYPSPTPFVCAGTNAWCKLPYTEKCGAGNSGSRTCYATQCSANGGADKCQWGVGSCCSKCSDGSSDAATCPDGIAPVIPTSTPGAAPTPATAPSSVPATPAGTIDSVQILYGNGASYTVSRNNNACTSAQRTVGTCPSGDCRIDTDAADQPNQVRVFKKNGNFKINKVMLYRGCPCNPSGICDTSKGGQAQQIRDDFCFGGNDAIDHFNKMSCKFDGSDCSTSNNSSTPPPEGSCTGGTGGTNPQPPPQQPQPTACPEGKIDSQGNCNPACCASDNDCYNGQSCSISNGFCGRSGGGKSCNPNSGHGAPTAAPQPATPPPQQPPNQCTGNGAACNKPYSEACGNGGTRTCYATVCNGAGNLDKCVWGPNSYCDACVGGSNPQPTAPPAQPPSNQCAGPGAACRKPYPEACQNGGTRICYATTCNGAGNLDKCVWGPNSYCDACVGGSNPQPITPPPQQPPNQCTGNGAACNKAYSEACSNGGTRICYATVCNGAGNLDKCVWGPNSYCDACVGGSNPQPTTPSSNAGSIHVVINVDPAVKTAQPNANWLGYFIYDKLSAQPVGGNNGDHLQPYGTGSIDEYVSNLDPSRLYHIEPRLKYTNGTGNDVPNLRIVAMQCGEQTDTPQIKNYCNVLTGNRVSFYIQNENSTPSFPPSEPTIAPTEAQATYSWKGYVDIPTALRINSLIIKWYEYQPNSAHDAGRMLGAAGIDQSGEFGQAPNGFVRYGIHVNNLANKQIIPQIIANYAFDPTHNYTFENCDAEGFCPVLDISQGIKGFTLFDLSKPHSLRMPLDINLDIPFIRNLSFAVRVRQAIFSSQAPYRTYPGNEIGQGSVVQENGSYFALVDLQGLQGNAFYVRPEVSFDLGNKHFTLTPKDTDNTPQGYYLAETNGSVTTIHIDIPFTVGTRDITFKLDFSNSPLDWLVNFIDKLNVTLKVWFSDNSTLYGDYALVKDDKVLKAVVPRLGNAVYYFQGQLTLQTPIHDININTDAFCGGHCWIDLSNAPDLTQIPIKFVPPESPFAPSSADVNGDGYVNAQDFTVMMRRTVRVNSSEKYAIQASKIISNVGKKVITENNSKELLNYLKNYKKKSVTNTAR